MTRWQGKMNYYQARIELERGCYTDLPDEHLLRLLNRTFDELVKRGYEISMEEFVLTSIEYNESAKAVEFFGKA